MVLYDTMAFSLEVGITMWKRLALTVMLISVMGLLAACGQSGATASAAEPLMKFDGNTIVFSDVEIVCH
jgi:ABC-type glycerol-3-phosphate transport system substrate-binding protein